MAIKPTIDELQKQLEITQKMLELERENEELLQKQANLKEKIANKEAESLVEQKALLEDLKKLTTNPQDLQIIAAQQEQINKDLEKQVELIKTIVDDEKKRAENVKNLKTELDNIRKASLNQGKVLANLLGINESDKDSLIFKILSDPKTVFEGFGKEAGKTGTGMQALGSMAKNASFSFALEIKKLSQEAFKQYDIASSQLNKATGAAGALNGLLSDTARGSLRFGISFAEAGKAIEGLFNNLNTFNSLSKSTQDVLVRNVGKLEQLGIASSESAKQIGTLSQIMGQSDIQSSKTINQMAMLGVAIGKSPQQISQDFAQASDKLAGYGKNMINVFKNLEIQSKATGVAVGDLISVTEKYLTFEGAATAAGKLNAALGGNFINTMELLEASAEDPAKAIDLLRRRMDEAGVSFNEMSFFEKRMIADAAGFRSIEEATRVLSMSNAEREKSIKADAERLATQERLDKAIEKSIPVQKKLELIFANLAVTMAPIVETLSDITSQVLEMIDNPVGTFFLQTATAAGALATVLNPVAATIGGIVYGLYKLHDALLKPHSPILFDTLKELPNTFNNIGISSKMTTTEIEKASNSLARLNNSSLPIASNGGMLRTQNLKTLEDTGKIISNIGIEKTMNTMKIISNNINQQQTIPSYPNNTTVEVHIGADRVKDLVSKVVNKQTINSLTSPATLDPASKLR